MAGSRRSPLLRDQWRAAKDPGDRERDRDRDRARGPDRDRGRDRDRDRDHRHRLKESELDRRPRSPPPQRRAPPSDREAPRHRRDSSPSIAGRRGSAASGRPTSREERKPGARRFSPSPLRSPIRSPRVADRDSERRRPPEERRSGRPPRRDDSPAAQPPLKRRRTRSPSPRSHHHHHRRHRSKSRESRDRGHSGRHLSVRATSRRRSPHREKERQERERRGSISREDPFESDDYGKSRSRRSRSPLRRDERKHRSRERSRSGGSRRDYHHRASSRDTFYSRNSRSSVSPSRDLRRDRSMNSTRPIQSIVDDSERPPSPLRPIPSFDADGAGGPIDGESRIREAFPMHGMRASDVHGNQRPRPPRPHVDTRQYSTSPQYVTPTSSYHGSPSGSPYSSGRGGWGGQPPYHAQHGQMHGHSPPYRQNNYGPQGPPQGQYYQTHQGEYSGPPNHMQQGYSGPPYRGGHSSYRGNYQNQGDRRFSGPGPQNYNNGPPQRGRGHFSNLQWTASGSRGRGGQHSPHTTHAQSSQPPFVQPPPSERMSPDMDESDNPFRPSKDLQVEDQGSKPNSENGDAKKMPPPARQSSTSSTPAKEGGKFSFAFKAKTTSAPVPKPVPDLAQRMQVREPPPRAVEPPRSRMSSGPPPKFRHDIRLDRRDRERDRERDRDRDRDRIRDRDRDDRRDPRDIRTPRDIRDSRDARRDDRRFDYREDRRRDDRRPDFRSERRRERTPEPPPKKQKKILTRIKPRPTLSEEFADSDSVYYRKPGNESVIGAGTYGKVFKAIHIYTKNKVALKKIRMEGEKDGFPVTAVREIKLLQHLRNHNVVSLLEVMVEKNECFMVFEYLSHDLTGLINHPTFTLTAAHKKNLAKQMFEGLNYLHHRGVLHRDIKAANILISNQGLLKFADFGLARFFSKSRQLDYTNRVITIWYRPPELLLGETRYGPAVDVWSAACVYMEMFTKKAVFPGEGGEISQLDKLYNSLGTPTRADWPDIVEMPWFELMRPTERKKRIFEDLYRDVLTPAALDLVGQMFRYDPAKRPTAEEVLQHPYFVSEEPAPQQPVELENIEGDWHEFESKALRKERDREARRAEYQKEKEKRKASASVAHSAERDTKRMKHEAGDSAHPPSQAVQH